MPGRWSKPKTKGEDNCMICGGKIFLAPGSTLTWVHADKSQEKSPMPHVATPRRHK